MDFCGKVVSLLFNMLSRFVIAFLSRSKYLLISWLQSTSTEILEPKKIKSVTVSIVSSSICHLVLGPDGVILAFWMLSFKPAFSLSSFIKRLFSFSSLSAIRVVSFAHLRLLIFLPAILILASVSSSPAFPVSIVFPVSISLALGDYKQFAVPPTPNRFSHNFTSLLISCPFLNLSFLPFNMPFKERKLSVL